MLPIGDDSDHCSWLQDLAHCFHPQLHIHPGAPTNSVPQLHRAALGYLHELGGFKSLIDDQSSTTMSSVAKGHICILLYSNGKPSFSTWTRVYVHHKNASLIARLLPLEDPRTFNPIIYSQAGGSFDSTLGQLWKQ